MVQLAGNLIFCDDDINTVIAYVANKGLEKWIKSIMGTMTWQMEVGRNYTEIICPDANWGMPYQRINSMNIILALELARESKYGTR